MHIGSLCPAHLAQDCFAFTIRIQHTVYMRTWSTAAFASLSVTLFLASPTNGRKNTSVLSPHIAVTVDISVFPFPCFVSLLAHSGFTQ
jgi:hypothetical protein